MRLIEFSDYTHMIQLQKRDGFYDVTQHFKMGNTLNSEMYFIKKKKKQFVKFATEIFTEGTLAVFALIN